MPSGPSLHIAGDLRHSIATDMVNVLNTAVSAGVDGIAVSLVDLTAFNEPTNRHARESMMFSDIRPANLSGCSCGEAAMAVALNASLTRRQTATKSETEPSPDRTSKRAPTKRAR